MIHVATHTPAAFPALARLASFDVLERHVPDLGATFRRHLDAAGCDGAGLLDVRGARTGTGIGFAFVLDGDVMLTWEERR